MAEKIVSPGVFTKEIDKSFLPAAIAEIGAAVIGPTVKGPALVPTIISSMAEYEEIFGTNFSSGSGAEEADYSYLTSLTAKEYLKNANQITVVRVLAGSYSGASATISSSIDAGVLGNGTGIQATGSFHIASAITQSLGGDGTGTDNPDMGGARNVTSFSIGDVKFIFTSGSGTDGNISQGVFSNSSTRIFIQTGSNVGDDIRDAINNSQSLHNLPISASSFQETKAGPTHADTVTITASYAGSFETPSVVGGRLGYSGSLQIITGSPHTGTKQFQFSGSGGRTGVGDQTGTNSDVAAGSAYGPVFGGGEDLNVSGSGQGVFKNVFKLHTIADGEVLNSGGGLGTYDISNNMLTSGSKDNLRYEISNINYNKGTFTLAIRRGDDLNNRKQIIENYIDLDLDPNSSNYIASRIGDMKMTIRTDENGNPFLQPSGSYPNKSKYVRVEVFETTPKYLDENGNVRIPIASASLPTFHSGSNSGSYGGSFEGGGDGTVTHPKTFYELISENSSQGLDPSNDGGTSGYDDYINALKLLNNADQYDFNLLLMPGIIDSIHSGVISKAVDVCEDRGDCFVLIDPVQHGRSPNDAIARAEARNSNYASMYWPWVKLPDNSLGKNVWVPPSVTLAGIYSFNDQVAHEWHAPAGLNRGTIETAERTERKLTQSIRDDLYSANINPIASFPGQGVCVWGQKTLQKKASALDRVNVRRLLIKVKKFIASSSRFLVFEQNNAATRRRFLQIANPFLEQIQSQSGLNAFRVVMDETNNTPDVVDRNILYGQIFVQPTKTAEFIILDFTVQPSGATFEG